jgi:hypothetical protein
MTFADWCLVPGVVFTATGAALSWNAKRESARLVAAICLVCSGVALMAPSVLGGGPVRALVLWFVAFGLIGCSWFTGSIRHLDAEAATQQPAEGTRPGAQRE